MNTPGRGIDVRGQRVGIRRLELRHLPPFEHRIDQTARVAIQLLVGGEFIKQVGARFPLSALRLLAARELQSVEQQLPELLRRTEIELVADEPVDFLFKPNRALCKCTRQPRKNIAIDFDAGVLHRHDNRNQRPFERFVDGRHSLGRKPRLQRHPKPQRHVGIFGGILRRLVERHGRKRLVGFLGAGRMPHRLRERHAGVAEVAFGKGIHPVLAAPAIERIRKQHRVIERRDLDAAAAHDQHVVFDVLPDLQDRRIFEQRTQYRQRFGGIELVRAIIGAAEQITARSCVRERHIARLARRDSKR